MSEDDFEFLPLPAMGDVTDSDIGGLEPGLELPPIALTCPIGVSEGMVYLQRFGRERLRAFLNIVDAQELGWAMDPFDEQSLEICRGLLAPEELAKFERALASQASPPPGYSNQEVLLTLQGFLHWPDPPDLKDLENVSGVEAAVLVARDGQILAPLTGPFHVPLKAHTAVVWSLLGHHFDGLRLWTVEGPNGALVFCPLDEFHALWLVGNGGLNLGRVRFLLTDARQRLLAAIAAWMTGPTFPPPA